MQAFPPILSIADDEVDCDLDKRLRALLVPCFPHEPVLLTRRYVKEPPAQRFLMKNEDGSIRAHVAVHLKTVRVEGADVRIGGIAEVAVDPAYRGQGCLRRILPAVHSWLLAQGVSFAMLIGNPSIYRSSGYRSLLSPIRYLDEGCGWKEEVHGLAMVRELGSERWPAGVTDLRGPLF